MTWNKENFLKFIEEKWGNFYLGDNGSAKIIEKGTISLGNRKTKAENVWLVENM